MRKTFSPVHILFFFFSAGILGIYFMFLRQVSGFTIQNHALAVEFGSFLVLNISSFLLLFSLWVLLSKMTASTFGMAFDKSLSRNLLTFTPVMFLLFLPAVNSFYMSADDLSQRLQLLGIAVLFAVFYLNASSLSLLSQEKSRPLFPIIDRFSALSLKSRLVILFICALLVYNLGSVVMLTEGITLSGDEPHYLVISQSLLEDGDFDLSNNYASHDYREYMPPTTRLDPHIAPRTQQRYSFHSPGLSVILLPFYALGSFFGGKAQIFLVRFGMSLFGALLGLQVFLFAVQEWKKEKLALGVWAVFSFSTPVFFYALHIYPEIIIALFSLFIFRRIRFSSSFSKLSLMLLGGLLSLFIWLHAVKYIFILIPLFFYVFWALMFKHRIGYKLIAFLAFPIGLTLLHLAYSHSFYGSYSIFSVSLKGATSAGESIAYLRDMITGFSMRARLETLAGYFLDQRDGLLLYAPVYVFAFCGLIEMIRHKRRDLGILLLLTAPYVLFHAFLTQRASFAPQARPLVAVFWVSAIFLGWFLTQNEKKIFTRMSHIAAFLSVFVVYLLLRNPWALYQSTTASESEHAGRLFASLSHLNFYMPQYLPSFLKRYDTHWLPNYIWLGIIALFFAVYIFSKKRQGQPRFSQHLIGAYIGLAVIFFWFVLYPRTALRDPVNTTFPSRQKITFYALGQVVRMIEPGRFQIPADRREYIFYFSSWRKIGALDLEFGSQAGDYYVEIDFFDSELFRGETSAEIKTLTLPGPMSYPYKNTNLYRISIYLERTSSVSITAHPYEFSIEPRI